MARSETGRAASPGRNPGRLAALGAALLSGALIGAAATWFWLRPPPPPRPDALVLEPAAFADLPGWAEDDLAEALPALRASCARIAALKAEASLGPGGTAGEWKDFCAGAAALPPDRAAIRAFLEARAAPLLATSNGAAEGLFTGYYEPLLDGARTPGGRYSVPLLARPDDLVTVELGRFRDGLKGERIAGRIDGGALVPYPDRAAIAKGALGDRARPLVWLADPVDAFFLHIQGSGRVALAEGGEMRVGYAAQNGHPYVAIGRELVRRGALPKDGVNMPAIKDWLAAHPGEAAGVLDANPSYVFFRELPMPDGPVDGPPGAENVPLSAGRSLAVDRKFMALGLPLWLDTTVPAADGSLLPLRRLMMAQDTGGAIRGPVRGDVFWGRGPEAERRAGAMKQPGRYWLIVPKAVAERAAAGEDR